MMPLNEVLMNLYLIIAGILLTFFFTGQVWKDKKSKKIETNHWYLALREQNPLIAYMMFGICFLINLWYLGLAYTFFIQRGNLFSSCDFVTISLDIIKTVIFLLVPITLGSVFNIIVYKGLLKKTPPHYDKLKNFYFLILALILDLVLPLIIIIQK